MCKGTRTRRGRQLRCWFFDHQGKAKTLRSALRTKATPTTTCSSWKRPEAESCGMGTHAACAGPDTTASWKIQRSELRGAGQRATANTRKYISHLQLGLWEQRGPLAPHVDVDSPLVQFLNAQYIRGAKPSLGEAAISALMCLRSTFRRISVTLRAVRGWRKLCPSRLKTLRAITVWSAIACRMIEENQLRLASLMMLMVTCYWSNSGLGLTLTNILNPHKPAAWCWLIIQHPEAGVTRSKTRQSDGTVPVDHPNFQWWWLLLEELSSCRLSHCSPGACAGLDFRNGTEFRSQHRPSEAHFLGKTPIDWSPKSHPFSRNCLRTKE